MYLLFWVSKSVAVTVYKQKPTPSAFGGNCPSPLVIPTSWLWNFLWLITTDLLTLSSHTIATSLIWYSARALARGFPLYKRKYRLATTPMEEDTPCGTWRCDSEDSSEKDWDRVWVWVFDGRFQFTWIGQECIDLGRSSNNEPFKVPSFLPSDCNCLFSAKAEESP